MRGHHLPAFLATLRLPGYRRLWGSIAVANVGRWAITMAIGWLLLMLTKSAFWVGAGMFALQGPALVGAPLAGVLADRVDRRMLLAVALIVTALTLGALAILVAANLATPGWVLALTLIIGLAGSMQTTAWNALAPTLIAREQIFSAIALQGTARQGAEFLGPALGSLIIAVINLPAVFVCGALLYLAAALQPLRIPTPARASRALASAASADMRAQRGSHTPLVATLLLLVSLHCSLTMAFMGLLPVFAQDTLHGDSGTYGALLTAIGLGALTATLVLASIRGRRWRGPLYGMTAIGSGVLLLALGGTRAMAPALVAAGLMGAAQAAFMAFSLTFVQERTDDAVRGRVSSLYIFFSSGVMSVASWGYGALAVGIASGTLLAGGGSLFVVAAIAIWLRAPHVRALVRWQMPVRSDPSVLWQPAVVTEVHDG